MKPFKDAVTPKRLIAGLLVICLSLLLVVWSCGGPNTMDGLPAHTLNVAGIERTYRVYVPASASGQSVPLVVAFHGGGMMHEDFPQQLQFQALADAEGFILAFPQGYAFPGNEGEWQLNTTQDSRHDVDFVAAMIDDIASRNSIDSSRIYAMGYSLGSMFSYEVACQMSDRFAAVASYAGTMPVSPTACEPQRFAPIMHIHGTEDGIISYNNTWDWKSWDEVGTMMDIPSLVSYWQTKYSCQNSSETASGSFTHFVHDTCEQNARVEHHRVGGQHHDWPGSINGTSTHQVIWSFLSGFTL